MTRATDRNFKDFRPMIFTTLVEVGDQDGDIGKGLVSINDRPFILEFVTHQIMKPVDFPNGFDGDNQGWFEFQHGLYTIDWSLYNQDRYWQGDPPMADAAFGSVRHGRWIKLTAPIALEKSRTLNVTVQNIGLKRDAYTVQVLFHGVEDYRKYDPTGTRLIEEGGA